MKVEDQKCANCANRGKEFPGGLECKRDPNVVTTFRYGWCGSWKEKEKTDDR